MWDIVPSKIVLEYFVSFTMTYKSVTNNALFIPTVVIVLLWVCVVVKWAVLWDQWNAL